MLSDRLKEARIKAKLTQKQVAEKVGIATTTLSGYERGASDPDVGTLCRLMDALGTDANFLYQDYNQEETKKAPAPEGAREKEHILLDETNDLLVELGYIRKGQQLSDADLAFLTHIMGLLDAWFRGDKA